MIRFLIYSLASCDETLDHLENLNITGSIKDNKLFNDLHSKWEVLDKKLNNFIKTVEKEHNEDMPS
jgi:four helix bundle protein